MNNDFKKIIPARYQDVSYENDILEEIKQIVLKQIRKRGGLYIWGHVGSGKTHMACAIAKKLIENGFNVMFYNTGDFIEKLREEFERPGNDTSDESLFRETMNFDGVLIFDDIGAENLSDWVRERLYLIINKKYEDMNPVIFTSNCDLEDIGQRMGDRVSSRIKEWAYVIWLTSQDKRITKI